MVNLRIVEKSSSNPLKALLSTYEWADPILKYGFRTQDIDKNGISYVDEGQWRPFYKAIFDNIATFTQLNFRETSFEDANLGQTLQPGGGGQSSNPYPDVPNGNTYTTVGIQGSVAAASAVVYQGQWSDAWYHEIGHSLGLAHPFERAGLIQGVASDSDLGTHFLHSSLYSVMSYSGFHWGEDNPWTSVSDAGETVLNASVGSYMPLDVAALQHMYGTKAFKTDNTVYTFGDELKTNKGYTTIWDTGGGVTLQYVGDSRAQIDLRAATLKDEIGGGGFLSTSETLTGGFVIANGVVIEEAIGGAKDDILHGQDLDNVLIGNGGNDVLFGHAGNDLLDGGSGSDRLDGGAGNDQARFSGRSQDYAIVYDATTSESAFAIEHRASGDIDTLISIEFLAFKDTVLGSHNLFANLAAQFGSIASDNQATYQMALSAKADDPIQTDVPDIDGAFTASAQVVFADLDGGSRQRVFDLGNGPGRDDILLSQVGNGDDMAFEILTGSTKHRIAALDTIVEGETAKWRASVDSGGMMRLYKNDHLVVEG